MLNTWPICNFPTMASSLVKNSNCRSNRHDPQNVYIDLTKTEYLPRPHPGVPPGISSSFVIIVYDLKNCKNSRLGILHICH